jgi:RHS repeat-associated protein
MNLRFPGQYFDQETKTHYNFNRDYQPGMGRYLQADPIGLVDGVNVYDYGSKNPLRYFDPNGLLIAGEWCNQPQKDGLSKRSQVEEAERKIRKELDKCSNCKDGTSCIPCKYKDLLLKKLDTVEYRCPPSGAKCGYEVNDGKIDVYPPGFNQPRNCNCVAATVYHELLHTLHLDEFPYHNKIPPGEKDPIMLHEIKCWPNLCGS